jgi:hypothetical protein
LDTKKRSIILAFLLIRCIMGTNTSNAAQTVEGFQAEPSLSVAEEYDDNIGLSGTLKNHDYITMLTPRIALSYKGVRADSSLSYEAVAEFYKEHSELNTVKHIGNFMSRYQLSQTAELKVQDGFVYSPEATDIAPTVIVPPRTKQYNNSASASISQKLSPLTSVSVAYNYVVQRYENSGLIGGTVHDSAVHGVQLNLVHGLTRTDTLTASAGYRYFKIDDFSRQQVYTISLGGMHLFSESFSLDAIGGANLYQDPSNRYLPSALFNVALKKSWQDTSASLSYLRDLTVGSGIATSAVATQAVLLGVERNLTQKLRATLSGSYAVNKSLSGPSVDTTSYGGTAALDYDITAWLKGQIRYSYFQQRSHGTVGNEFRRNLALVGLTAVLPK